MYHEFDILLAVNFLDTEEKNEIIETVRKKVFERKNEIIPNASKRIHENDDADVVANLRKEQLEKGVDKIKENEMIIRKVDSPEICKGLPKDDVPVEFADQGYQAAPQTLYKMPKGLEIIPFTKAPSDNINDDIMEIPLFIPACCPDCTTEHVPKGTLNPIIPGV